MTYENVSIEGVPRRVSPLGEKDSGTELGRLIFEVQGLGIPNSDIVQKKPQAVCQDGHHCASKTRSTKTGVGRLVDPGLFQSRSIADPASASLGCLFQSVSRPPQVVGLTGDKVLGGRFTPKWGLDAHLVLGSASCLSSLSLLSDHL